MPTIDDPSRFFAKIGVLVYPTPRGSGMKVKVLEALAYGVPVVTNEEGAEGIMGDASGAVVRAESDAEFADEAAALLANDDRRIQLGRAGRRYVTRVHGPAPTIDRLMDAYQRMGLT